MSDQKNVGVIGAGAFGTSLSKVLAENGHNVSLWCFSPGTRDDIQNSNENREFLSGVKLPGNINATCELKDAVEGMDFILLALPSVFLLDTVKQILSYDNIREGHPVIATVTKGFLPGQGTPEFIVDTLENYLPGFYKGNVVYISGPSHAEEVGRGKITGLISASANPRNSILFRELLSSEQIKVFSSLDVVGVQTCAAIKNVIAIAFGILDALKEETDIVGDNTESLLFAAGLNEIQYLGRALGSTHPETFTSIAGVGDLDVTCRSVYGRNRRFGREIILKKLLDPYKNLDDLISHIGDIGYLPEGAMAAKYAVNLGEKHKLKLPIIRSVFMILDKQAPPEEVLNSYLLRFNS